METGAATVTGRNEWDVTMELVNIAIHYDAIGSEEELKEKFKEYYQMVLGVKAEVHDDLRCNRLKTFYSTDK